MCSQLNLILASMLLIILGVATDCFGEENAFDPVTMEIQNIDEAYAPGLHPVFIPIGKENMTGILLSANGIGPHPTIILLHGLPGYEKNLDLAQSMRRAGFNVLFFHFRGSWGSDGNYSFISLHQDVLSSLEFLLENAIRYRVDIARLSLVGHSFGGYAALRSATLSEKISCVVALSAANPAVIAGNENALTEFGKYVDKQIMLKGITGKQGIEELTKHAVSMDTRLYGKTLRDKRLLLITGQNDTVIQPLVQKEVVKNYKKIDGLVMQAYTIDGDHTFSFSRIKLQRLVVEWLTSTCL